MNRHEHALQLLRSQIHLTPSQQLEALELSMALQRKRVRATFRAVGTGALCFATMIATACRYEEAVLGAIGVGVVGALLWIWNSGPDETAKLPAKTAPASEPGADAETLRAIDERLANLEAILNYEEKIAARRQETAQAEAANSRATRRLGAD